MLMFNNNVPYTMSPPNIQIGPEPEPESGPTNPGLDAGRVGVL